MPEPFYARFRLRQAWPYLVLLAEVLAFYGRVLFVPGYVVPYDMVWYDLPLATQISETLRHGRIPLWDPYTYCGFPFFANLQTQFWYPPALAAIALSGFATGHRLLVALEWQMVAHVFLAGVGTYWLLRRLGAGRAAATLAGTICQLGAYFASSAAVGPVDGAAWMPLAWLAVVALRETWNWRWVALLAVSFGMSILAGFPAITAIVVGSTLLLAAAFVVMERRPARLLGAWALACLWAGLLAAVQLLPTWQLVRLGESLGRATYGMGSVPLAALATMVEPNRYHELDVQGFTLGGNAAFAYFYCGVPALAMAAYALVFRRRRETAVFALVTAAALAWTLGRSTPVGPFFYRLLPPAVRAPLYVEFTKSTFVLGLAVLAGLGMDALPVFRRRAWAAALVALAALDLISAASGRALTTGKLADHRGVSPTEFEGAAETVTGMRALVHSAVPGWRVEPVEDSFGWAVNGAVMRVPMAAGNEPLYLARLMAVRRLYCESPWWERNCPAVRLTSPVMSLLGVRYLVTWAGEDPRPIRDAGFARILDLPGHRVFENPRALPRFFLVGEVRPAANLRAALDRMRAPDFDPGRTAVVEGAAGWSAPAPPPDAVRVLAYEARRVRLAVAAPSRAFLVTSETNYPGWRASIDGRPALLVMTNGAFRGLAVPPGQHVVEMWFRPVILWWGLALTLAAWCAVFAALRLRVRPAPTLS